jgi:Zn-dependent protease
MDMSNISNIVLEILLVAPGFLLGITIHEFAHGYIALRFGDPTAKNQGRLTFNPISHLDPVGTLMLVLTRTIGWAKPVPVNPRYFKNPRSDMLWVSLAGPAANLIAATAMALVLQVLFRGGFAANPGQVGHFFLQPMVLILYHGVRINVLLAILNLIPVPPLDGSQILSSLLPPKQAYEFEKLAPYGFFILMALVFTNVLGYVLTPPMNFVFGVLMTGLL